MFSFFLERSVPETDTGTVRPEFVHDHARRADAMARASLLLVESVIHGLIAKSLITVADAVEIIQVAVEVQDDEAQSEAGAASLSANRSLILLQAMQHSLSRDLVSSTGA